MFNQEEIKEKLLEYVITILEEKREEARASNGAPPAIGPPHQGIFHSFVDALSKTDCGQKNKEALTKWLATLESDHKDKEGAYIDQFCQSFQVFSVNNQPDLCRLQLYMPTGPLRVTILNALDNLSDVRVSAGPPPRSYLEQELADWMSVLQLE